MSDIAIRVENLSKMYRLGVADSRSDTLAGSIAKTLKAPFRNFRNLKNLGAYKSDEEKDIFYALKDVSFEVKKGDTLAIIGRNGAGKSTLLKVVSRITDPSKGRIDVYGRISSLLEVGTGFHPELTGRENVYLNGSILGMKKHEIDRNFDAIVDFSGVSKFIDTPVKRYSSGMKVRLAFSVAAHLDAEILLIDEVLAVGDVEFQKKCLGKMDEVANAGRTVLFVSHNMGAIKELCSRGLVLEKGQTVFEGDINQSIGYYLEENRQAAAEVVINRDLPFSTGFLTINDQQSAVLTPKDTISVSLPIAAKNVVNPWIIFIIEDYLGNNVVNHSIKTKDIGVPSIDGEKTIQLDFPALWLAPGMYSAYFKVLLQDVSDKSGRIVTEKHFFEVVGSEELERGGFHSGKKATMLAPYIEWQFNESKVSI